MLSIALGITSKTMNTTAIETYKVTNLGLEMPETISIEEWSEIGRRFGDALQKAAWSIGDWMVYGERKWGKQLHFDGADFDPKVRGRTNSAAFDEAIKSTGLDRNTLSHYASVCRRIPREKRSERFSFAHHRVLSMLESERMGEWMLLMDSESISEVPTVKRLAMSVRIIGNDTPRIVTASEIMQQSENAGHDNYVPHLSRLVTILRKTLPDMDKMQRTALKEDLAQLWEIVAKL